MMVLDAAVEERLKAERAATGADRYDEVWDGVYMVASPADNEHQDVQAGLASAVRLALGWDAPAQVMAANVSDREEQWEHNYRCPDLVVVVPGGAARDCGTHWCGGPDLCVEIVSPGDRSREKFHFYSGIGVRELLLVDRDPWALELYRLRQDRLELIGRGDMEHVAALKSVVVPVSFRLVSGTPRPQIEVTHHDGVQRWTV